MRGHIEHVSRITALQRFERIGPRPNIINTRGAMARRTRPARRYKNEAVARILVLVPSFTRHFANEIAGIPRVIELCRYAWVEELVRYFGVG